MMILGLRERFQETWWKGEGLLILIWNNESNLRSLVLKNLLDPRCNLQTLSFQEGQEIV